MPERPIPKPKSTRASSPPSRGFQPARGPSPGDRAGPSKQDKSEGRRSAYQSMAGVGIGSLGGRTTADEKGREARDIQRKAGVETITRDSDRDKQEKLDQILKDIGVSAKDDIPIISDEDDKENIFDKVVNKVKKAPGILQNLASQWGGPIPVLLMKALIGKEPTKEQLADPNFLAMMFDQLSKKEGAVDQFVEDYRGTMAEALGGSAVKDMSDADLKAAFKSSLEGAKQEAIDSGIFQGSEAQRRIDPWDYYNPDLWEGSAEQAEAEKDYPKFLSAMGLSPISSRFGNTMGNLEDIASIPLDSIPYDERGREFRKQVIEAREAVSRSRQEDRQGGGGGAGIPSLYAGPIDPPPGLWQDPTDPTDPINITFPIMPDPDPTIPVTTPTPFNYSQWPQFGPAGGPIPNYVNQGLGSAPQFNYWNQIANTFPGMR